MDLETYIDYFSTLHRKVTCGVRAPHKPILLLSIINLFEKGYLDENRIELSNELKLVYTQIWKSLAGSNQGIFSAAITLPMWRMQKELFWHLKPTAEYKSELRRLAKELPEVDEQEFKQYVDHVELDTELSFLMTLDFSRNRLKEVLLSEYFNLSLAEYESIEKSIDYDEDELETSSNEQSSEYVDQFTLISIELQCVFQIEYYSFIKNNSEQRRIFMSLFPSVSSLYDNLKNNALSKNDIPSSFKPAFIEFLKKLEWKVEAEDNLHSIRSDIRSFYFALSKDLSILESTTLGSRKATDSPEVIQTTMPNLHQESVEDADQDEVINDNQENRDDETSISYQVINSSNHTKILDTDDNVLYNSTGYTLFCKDNFYRLFKSYSSLSINKIEKTPEGKFVTGDRIVNADNKTALFKALLNVDSYFSLVFEEDRYCKLTIYLNGFVYSASGDLIRYDHAFSKPVIEEGNETKNQEEVDAKTEDNLEQPEGEAFVYEPKGAFIEISNYTESCFDYFWILAIIDLMKKKITPKSLSFEEIGLMAIANAWEFNLNNPLLSHKTEGLDKCMEYMKSKPEYCDVVDLKTRADVYQEIKDVPIDNKMKNAINIITTKAPYNILMAWIPSKDYQQIYIKSLSFSRSCLYSIHARKIDPYIEINPNWKRYLISDNNNLHKYLELKLIGFLSK